MLEIANGIVMGPINAMNALIEQANRLPLIEFKMAEPPPIAEMMQEQIEHAKGVAEQGRLDIAAILSAPMAGTGAGGFMDFVAESVEQGDAQARHEVEMEAIRKRNEEKLQIQKDADAARLEQQNSFVQTLLAQEQAAAGAEQDQFERQQKAKTEGSANLWSDLTSISSTGSKKLFNISKTANIAKATVDSIEAAVTAWKNGMTAGGPFGGPALAATYAAASLLKTGALISSLKSASFNGGGGAAGGGGGGASAPAAQATPPPNTFNVAISGMNPNQMFSGGQFGDIITVINDRIRAGDRLVGISA
jgi:hypothetical protein